MQNPKNSSVEKAENREKLEYIYHAYYDLMFRTVYSIVGDEESSADIVHEAILKIIRSIDTIRLDGTFPVKNYVYLTAKHTAIEYQHKKEKNGVVELDDPALDVREENHEAIPLNVLTSREKYEHLVRCVRSLPVLYRDVCYLKYVCELRDREIAELLHITEQAVGLRVFRGKQILRRMISEESEDEE